MRAENRNWEYAMEENAPSPPHSGRLRLRRFVLLAALVLPLVGGAARGDSPEMLRVRGESFVDAEGRQVLLHGLSVINKAKADGYRSWQGPEEFRRMKEWGMNCIRLGVLWDGVEPLPGEYDESYLAHLDERIAWAEEAGLFVMLDMHQDLFSVLYSDGAPEWATLTDGQTHIHHGKVWSDAYLTSPAVQRAFDNFWANAPGPGGIGIQDRFAAMWRHVAKRYAGNTTVIGYDLFNEPNIGSGNLAAQAIIIGNIARLLTEKNPEAPVNGLELADSWLTVEGRSRIMRALNDMEIYVPAIDSAQGVFARFERRQLMPMYERVVAAIREVDQEHIVFLETSMSANLGIRTAIEPVMGPNGERDPQQAYAPHGYDIVVDTADNAQANPERVRLIFERHAEAAKRLGMPMVVGEWGAYGDGDEAVVPAAKVVAGIFEEILCGDIYWDYGRRLHEMAYLRVLQRPIPLRVAGALKRYGLDWESTRFSCAWREDMNIEAPTRIYLPAWFLRTAGPVQLTPEGSGFEMEPAAPGASSMFLVVPPAGAEHREVVIAPRNPSKAAE